MHITDEPLEALEQAPRNQRLADMFLEAHRSLEKL
jgi:hypothetical protein